MHIGSSSISYSYIHALFACLLLPAWLLMLGQYYAMRKNGCADHCEVKLIINQSINQCNLLLTK